MRWRRQAEQAFRRLTGVGSRACALASQRNVVVASLRNVASEEWHLKVKFYLEGYPEPRILLFDLHRASGREDIPWPNAREPSLLG